MKWRAAVGLSVMAVLLTGSHARAGNSPGHEQVADIAWSQLTPQTRQQVGAILAAGDPQFRPASANEADVRRAFRKAATFPDEIKTNEHTLYESQVKAFNQQFDLQGVAVSQRVRCKSWHFLDKPIRDSGHHAPKDAESNANAALTLARKELSQLQGAPALNRDRKMQFWWLSWIEHIVGDLHQPLHCTSSFQFGNQGDGGGNDFALATGSLHSFWDSGIDHAKYAEGAQGKPTGVEQVTARWNGEHVFSLTSPAAKNLNVLSWIDAGAKEADKSVYEDIVPGAAPDAQYQSRHRSICKRGAILAGYRLANLLNAALGQ